jgi:hypothetical protein
MSLYQFRAVEAPEGSQRQETPIKRPILKVRYVRSRRSYEMLCDCSGTTLLLVRL